MASVTQDHVGVDRIQVYYTGLEDGGSTVINANITVGCVVVEDPDSTLGRQPGSGSNFIQPINVTRPQNELEGMKKFVVVDVPSRVNDIINTGTNQRRGGTISVLPLHGGCDDANAIVDGGSNNIAIGNLLRTVDDSFNLARSGDGSVLNSAVCAVAKQAATTNAALIRVGGKC